MNYAPNFPLLFLSLLLMFSCAKQTAPTGGPKDTIPPTLINSFPRNNATNVSTRTIELNFDEHINLDNPKEKIVITPDVGKDYDIIARKRTVTLTLPGELQDTTTYSINFQESVKDITEKNPAENLKIAFSTGTYIDSLLIRGKIVDALTQKEVKNATVALYAMDTFSIFNNKPSYFSKTNEKGLYSITNLKPGRYYIYAFLDANRNLIVDSRSESFAFEPEPINLTRNTEAPTLNTVRLDSRPLKLTSARPSGTYFNIKYSKGIRTYRLSSPQTDSLYSIRSDDNLNVQVYKTFPEDSIQIRIIATDSINQVSDTTLYAKSSPRRSTPDPFTISLKNWKLARDKGIIQGSVTFSKPISSINLDSIFYTIDSLNLIKFLPSEVSYDSTQKQIHFSKKIDRKLLFKPAPAQTAQRQPPPAETTTRPKPNQGPPKTPGPAPTQPYQITIAKGSFISVESDTSSHMQEIVKPTTPEETGVIRVNIQTTEKSFIVQLLDKSNNVLQSIINQSAAAFEDLRPGEYQLRLIIDKNNDGKWTPGNFARRQPTEPILYYIDPKKQQVFNLKANWEIGPLLISY